MKKLVMMFFIIFLMMMIIPNSFACNKTTKISQKSTHVVLKDIKTDIIIFRNKSFKISSSIKNSGNIKSKNFYLDYYLKSSDNNIYVGHLCVLGLDHGETRTITSSFKLPNSIRNTDYLVRIVADSTNQLHKENQTPNVFYSQKKVSVVTGKPVYITSDYIKNNAIDNAKVNTIVKCLKKRGLYALNYGLGPNKHYNILKNTAVPKDALIVNIYGGVCAGTIWEMAQPYYKKKLGTKKVFSIWINTKVDVKTIKFVKRAFDDNFTPKYGANGGFPDFNDLNKNGKFEPKLGEKDGLTYPGKLLDKNGYKYLYQKDGNMEKIVNAIYNQATN